LRGDYHGFSTLRVPSQVEKRAESG
jgi:hypothetical protein